MITAERIHRQLPASAARRWPVQVFRSGSLLGIIVVFVILTTLTWAHWGDVQVDCGREMYAPAEIVSGKMLYRDIFYPYGPLAPYWHAFLYSVFGERLLTLYLSGLAITLAFAVTLLAVARRLLPEMAAFVVSVCFLVQAFQPGLFNFVLPYAFAATMGALGALLTVYFLVRDALSECGPNLLSAGVAAGLSLCAKPEFGLAAFLVILGYATCSALNTRSLSIFLHIAKRSAPGVAIPVAIYGWFLWRLTPSVVLNENLFPAYFMQTRGAYWLKNNGALFYSFSPRQMIVTSIWALLTLSLWRIAALVSNGNRRWFALPAGAIFIVALEFLGQERWPSAELYFPRGTYWLAVAVCVALTWAAVRGRLDSIQMGQWIVAAAATLLAARVATKVVTWGYAIYYNPLLLLVFTGALSMVLTAPRKVNRHLAANVLVAVQAVTFIVIVGARYVDIPKAPLTTSRGIIYSRPDLAAGYSSAIRFINEKKALGERVVVLPEDTALYFLTATDAPNRFYLILPGILEPAHEDEYIAALRSASVKFIVLTNRSSFEYGQPHFGLDFNQRVYQWILSNFDVVGQIGHFSRDIHTKDFGALILSSKQ